MLDSAGFTLLDHPAAVGNSQGIGSAAHEGACCAPAVEEKSKREGPMEVEC
jgi:hypothetical protein